MSPHAPMLLAAYQCGPGLGSVSQIGWEWYHRLAARGPVTLVTHARNRAAIEADPDCPADADIVWIDTEWFAGPLYRLARRLFPHSEHGVFVIASLDFFLFDWLALRALRRLRPARRWAHTHIVTPVTLAAPSCLHRLGMPVVRGPLNCGLRSPQGFDEQLRHEREWLIRLRELPRVLDCMIGATRNAHLLLTATEATRQAVPARHRPRCLPLLENGVRPERFTPSDWADLPGPHTPLRVLFVGRMIALKGVDLLLRAAARLRAAGWPVELELVGDGPARAEWEALGLRLGLKEQVRFRGALEAAGVAQAMQRCHVFCLPSVRESGGAVLLEAMASRRPVIAVGWGGPAEIVDDEVGRAVPAHSPEQIVEDLARALEDCLHAPQAWAARGRTGEARVAQRYTWNAKIDAACALYSALADHNTPPRKEFALRSQSAASLDL